MSQFLAVKKSSKVTSRFCSILFSVFLLLVSHAAAAFLEESTFQKAREAYQAKNEALLTQYVKALTAKEYLLAPYPEYWLMLLQLEKADDAEVLIFLETYAGFPFANRLRGEWLKKLAKQASWELFFQQYRLYKPDDIGLQCENLYGQTLLNKPIDDVQVKNLWLTSQDQPSQCNRLFDLLIQSGQINTESIYARFSLALLDGKPDLAKAILQKLASTDAYQLKLIDRAYQSPLLFLNNRSASFKSRFGAELNVFALDRIARNDVAKAAELLHEVEAMFDAPYQSLAWSRVGYHAARAHDSNALYYFANAKNKLENQNNLQETVTYKEMFAWRTRAALRESNWTEVLNGIALMSEKQAQEGAWRYWKARALKALTLKEMPESASAVLQESTTLFSQLATERHYYGWLAAEELEASLSNATEQIPESTAEEMAQIANLPEIKRAVALKNLDMRWEAKLEWQAATRNFNDQMLLAAASYAQKLAWYDIAIITADSTKDMHNFNLRYPTPYRDLFKYAADDEQLDEAWVYGLTRQESRFMDDAKSNVGAAGLMQLMPATAKWAAKRKGLFGYSQGMIHDLRTNIELGAYYMRHTLDLLGGQAVLATAAYNAGPSRAKRWMADKPLEAAIFIETIPFAETRNYVQKVMANAHLYAPRLGTKIQSLKARLGVVPARVQQVE